jgi:hypothetical protein
MIQSTNVRLPKAPTVRPMIDISKFSVGHDFASLKTLNCKLNIDFVGLFWVLSLLRKKIVVCGGIGSSLYPNWDFQCNLGKRLGKL